MVKLLGSRCRSPRHRSSFFLFAFAAILAVQRAEADVVPQPVYVSVTSNDYPDMAFVLYRFKSRSSEPDAETARIGGAPLNGDMLAVLGVPKDLLEKSNGKIDPAWLTEPTPGVLHLDSVRYPLVYRKRVVLL